ncbi:MAG: thioredoxin domain-containing protein [Gemmatimonadota bacterium]|nr:thioredoxin domain-containing protein [Gemmatimonadota bacterium]
MPTDQPPATPSGTSLPSAIGSLSARSARRLSRVAATLILLAAAAGPALAQPQALDPEITAADHGRILGSEKAPIWMLIVSDFQCPFCRQWHHDTWPTLRKEYLNTGKIRVAYINMPLAMHANARPAALFAMCASVKGRFWQVADQLFDAQDKWKDLADPWPFFEGIARSVGLDGKDLRTCAEGKPIQSMVDADRTRMARAGAISTPTFFIGQSKIEGALPLAEFRQAIDGELRRAGQRP